MKKISLHITLSREHKDLQPQVAEVFKDFDVSFDSGLMRFSTEELAMQVIIWVGGNIAWDLLKGSIVHFFKKFRKASISLRDNTTAITYTVRPDLTVNVLVVPDRVREFERIKTFDDLVQYLQRSNSTGNYPTKKLGEVCDVFTDGDWIETKDQSSEGIRLIQTGNIGEGVFVDKDNRSRFISEETFKRLNCTEVFPGDILISRLPDPIGRACILPELPTRMITAVDCTVVRTNREKLLPEFLLLYANSAEYYDQLTEFLSGSTRTRISRGNLAKIEIPMPPVEEQRKIVARIEKQFAKIDEAARLRAQSQALADQLLPAALHEIFSSAESKGWATVNIGDKKAMQITSGGTPSRSNSEFYGGKITWLKSGELNDNASIEDSEEHITDEALQKSSAKIFPAGTVLLAMYGATAGKLGILAKSASTNQAVAGLTPNANHLDSKFLYYCLLFIRAQIIGEAWGGAQPNLSQTILKEFKIPLPPLTEQKQIVKKLDTLAEKARVLHSLQASQSADLKSLKQSILHEAFANNT